MSPFKRSDGYRYIRQYTVQSGAVRYALWEVREGMARRVATAASEQEYEAFLGLFRDDNGKLLLLGEGAQR